LIHSLILLRLHNCTVLHHLQPAELAKGAVDGALNFPLSSLREKLHELPQDKKLYVYCQVRQAVQCTATV
jgi:rhodanese-related sulfurtransferase